MKREINRKFLAMFLITAAAMATAACGNDEVTENGKKPGTAPEAEVENGILPEIRRMDMTEIESPFDDVIDEHGYKANSTELCYSSGDRLIFSESRYDESEYSYGGGGGDEFWWTSELCLTNLDGDISARYTVNRPNSVDHAVPYKEGVLYMADVIDDESGNVTTTDHNWELIYNDGEHEKIIDNQSRYGGGQRPYLTLVNDVPTYVVSGSNPPGNEDVYLVRVADFEPEIIETYEDCWTSSEDNISDGEHVAVMLYDATANGEEKRIIAYDEKGVKFEKGDCERVDYMGINGEYIIATEASSSNSEKGLVALVSMKDGEEKCSIETEYPMWHHMKVTDEMTAMLTSDGLYLLNSEKRYIQPCQTPVGFSGASYIYQLDDGRFIYSEGGALFIMKQQS